MNKMRKLATAMVLGLVMCMALFTTGAFAQNAHRGHIVSVNAVAVASTGDSFWNDFPFFGGFGCGNGFGPFFGGAFAHASVHILDGGYWY